MRRVVILVGFLLVRVVGWCQVGNEWIKFNQDYYKIPVAKNGMYRLTYTDLQDAGFPVSSVDPRRVQLFHRGQEQALYIEGESDAVFDATDFIEFYGIKNDGTLDASLYEPSSAQPHPYYNLYTDTTSYFLTYTLAQLGQRMESSTEINVTNIPKENAHVDEKFLVLSDQYSPGKTEYDYIRISAFDEGEGWTGVTVRDGQTKDYALTGLSNVVTSGVVPSVELMLVGRFTGSHPVELWVGSSAASLRLLSTQTLSGFQSKKINLDLAFTDIGVGGTFTLRIVPTTTGSAANIVSVSYIKVQIQQQTNAENLNEKFFQLRPNGTGKSYVEMTNFPSGARLYDVTDRAHPVMIRTTQTSTLNALVPSTFTSRKLFLTNAATKPSINKITFRNITPGVADYIIISHPKLRDGALGYDDPVKAYADYRESQEGGAYNTLVVDINQLYDQFNYGEISPRAIRNFMKWLIGSKMPSYLFLVGKGLDVNYNYYRNPSAFVNYKGLVPTAGYPASDMYYTAGLAGTTYEPAVPTGRLTAMFPIQVAAYLNKVKEMEALPYTALWRKNLLHLSGGIYAGEPQLFKQYMKDFQQQAETVFLGGKVKAIPKQSTDIDFINVSDEINKGLNLVTFYGHSSPGTIDFDIGFVSDPILGYNNKGKYPMFLLNGCTAGSYFLNTFLFGEDWIMTADKGAVGFIAHSGYGLSNTLKRYSDFFYATAYGDSTLFKQGIGDIQKVTAQRYMTDASPSMANVSQVQQMILLGDPAVKLFGAPKPDYAIAESDLYATTFDGNPITAQTDSFALHVIIKNFGMARRDTLPVRITRTFSDNSFIVYDTIFAPVLYADTLVYVIRKDRADNGGNNSFKIEIDPNNKFTELTKLNNVATLGVTIPLNGTRNLFPYDHSIVHTLSTDLRFQATDIFSDKRDFMLEIDTLQTFTSSYKQSFSLEGKVLVEKQIVLLPQDSLVYYWRTKLANPLPGESEEWMWSSFVYIKDGPDGWAQMHFPQYLKNESEGLIRDTGARELRFEETSTSVYINNFGSANPATNLNVSIKLNGAEYQLKFSSVTERVPCRNNTINLIAFSKVTTVPYAAIDYGFGDPRTCGKEPQVIGSFITSQLEIPGLGISEYIDKIKPGDSVVVFSIGNAGFNTWSAAVKNKLGDLGISVAQIDLLQTGEPVVIFGKKGSVSGSAVVHKTSGSPANQQSLIVSGTITGRYTFGNMKSSLIGPAAEWKNVHQQYRMDEASDVAYVNVYGLDLQGKETLLLEDVSRTTSLSGIDAKDYPYLKLLYHAEDDLNLTAPQLSKWIVAYTPVAEGILFFNGEREQVNLVEGETWYGTYGFVNISDKVFSDSLTVRTQFFNKTTRLADQVLKKIKAPAQGDTTEFSVHFNSFDKTGNNDLSVFVNPRILPEQYYENNNIEIQNYLYVEPDVFGPVMDVTIDGRHVQNEDFVSSNPSIVVKIWDENKFIHKIDTMGVKIFLQYPCDVDCQFEQIYFSNSNVSWQPGTAEKDFTVEFAPRQLEEGMYVLRVEASDARNNPSGANAYEISFQVSFESSITFMAPYPNPTQGNVTFTFTISGESSPDYLFIQIFGTDGRLVRELKKQDAFFVGTNELVWDGKDEKGEGLPSGLYVYHVNVFKENNPVNVTVPAGARYVKGGYGKIAIVR